MRQFQHDAAELLGQRRLEERSGYSIELADIDRKIWERIKQEQETNEYFSAEEIARRLGEPADAMEHVIEQGRYEGQDRKFFSGEEQTWGIVILDGPAAARYVTTQQARVIRSISAFDETDAALRSKLCPDMFAIDGYLDPPAMLWLLDTGEWVGVSHTQVGYGGEGPRMARSALVAAGVDEERASDIVEHRFCDAVDVADRGTWETSQMWPVEGRSWPDLIDGRLVVAWGPGVPRQGYSHGLKIHQPDPDPSGIYPSSHATPGWEQWIDFLDDEESLPGWAMRPDERSAWLFYTEAQADEHGFRMGEGGRASLHSGCPTVVLDQGYVSLWFFAPAPDEPGRLVHDDTIAFLKRAGLPTEDIEAQERRRTTWWSRLWRSLTDTKAPEPMFVAAVPY